MLFKFHFQNERCCKEDVKTLIKSIEKYVSSGEIEHLIKIQFNTEKIVISSSLSTNPMLPQSKLQLERALLLVKHMKKSMKSSFNLKKEKRIADTNRDKLLYQIASHNSKT